MARPRRPAGERDLVRLAAAGSGSASARAVRLARMVAEEAVADIERDPAELISRILNQQPVTPIQHLASDQEFGATSLVIADRLARQTARGGRRLPEFEWLIEDRRTVDAVTAKLAERYRRYLRDGER